MPYVKSMDRDQLMMTTLDMLVDQDSIVRVMDAFVESLDLQKLGFLFAEPGVTGRPAYNPSALLKLYIYGYKNSVRSSRKLQHECHVNLEVRWLTGGLEPDFRTISDFRKNNADALVRVFNEFNKIFHSYLLNGFVSIDGSKFLANNSKDNNFTLNKLDDRITWLENHCEEYLRQMEHADKEEDQGFIRYINKMACHKCPHRNKCHNSKKGFKEIEFRKDEFVKPHRQWLKCEGKKSDIKSRRRKTVLKKAVTIIFRPNREKMAQRMCLSEHPFGTLKRIQGSYYFLLRGNRKTQGEFALFSLAYNLQRLLNHLGFKKMMKQLIPTGCFGLNFCTIFIIQQLNHSTLELA